MNKPRASLLMINPQNEILLIKRNKDSREYWVFPGGSVEQGETIAAAANREALEETSFLVKTLRPIFSVLNSGRKEHFFITYMDKFNPVLGDGPERNRQNENNRYTLSWVKLNRLDSLNLYPLEAKDIIISMAMEIRSNV